jgi:Lon protease-like protein
VSETNAEAVQRVPVFPLPEAVLFPRQVLPLHIFEPRYRVMVTDALAGARLIAVALLKPNYESQYFTSHAPIHRLVGLGRIIASEKLEGGKFNILLRGEARAEVAEEFPGRPYRWARLKQVESGCNSGAATREELRRELCEAIHAHLAAEAEICDHYLRLFETPLPLGELTDLIAGGLPVVGELRQCLLAELDTCTRAKMLLEHIHTLASVTRRARDVDQRRDWKLN